MTSCDEVRRGLKELFPHLTDMQLDVLAKSGDELNILITRVLDDNIDPPTLEIKELVMCASAKYEPEVELNYPEVFEHRTDAQLSIDGLRSRAAELYHEASYLAKDAIHHRIKQARHYFSIEADGKREKAAALDRKAAMMLMEKCIDGPGPIDLHGLTVKEAVAFMDDLLKLKKFSRIEVVTGQAHRSLRIRPAMKEWFERNGFYCSGQGPRLLAIRKDPGCSRGKLYQI